MCLRACRVNSSVLSVKDAVRGVMGSYLSVGIRLKRIIDMILCSTPACDVIGVRNGLV